MPCIRGRDIATEMSEGPDFQDPQVFRIRRATRPIFSHRDSTLSACPDVSSAPLFHDFRNFALLVRGCTLAMDVHIGGFCATVHFSKQR